MAGEWIERELHVGWNYPDAPIRGFQIEFDCEETSLGAGDGHTVTREVPLDVKGITSGGDNRYSAKLSFDENVGGRSQASRNVDFRVRALGSDGRPYSAWDVESFNNPPPAAPSLSYIASIDAAIVTITASDEVFDFAGWCIHVSTDTDYNPNTGTALHELHQGNSFTLALLDDVVEYVWVAGVDAFGATGLFWSVKLPVERLDFDAAVAATPSITDLETVYGDTVSAAASAAAAAASEAAAIAAEAEAIIAQGAAEAAASDAAADALAAAGSATTAATEATDAATAASDAVTAAANAIIAEGNAETAATTSTTQAGNASVSATNAATSATNASGSAATATTQAGLAAGSATAAGGSATAASTSAGNAATSATNAGNSATSANTSAVNAASSFSDSNVLAAMQFPDRYDGTTGSYFAGFPYNSPSTITPKPSNATEAGYGPVYDMTAEAGGDDFSTVGVLPATPGRIYKAEIEFQRTASTGTPDGSTNMALVFRTLGADFTSDTGYMGPVSVSPNGSVQTISYMVSDTVSGPGIYNWPAGTVWLRAYGRQHFGSLTAQTIRVRRLTVTDVTEQQAALTSANAASTSASNASTSASAAGSSATAASTSATNAATSAGAASTSATNASNSATTASGHAATATTQAGNAATSAGLASGSATAASGSASSAATSATNAGNSATSAAASSVSAASSYDSIIEITRNGNFEQGKEGWDDYGLLTHNSVSTGRTHTLTSAPSGNSTLRSSFYYPIQAGANYRISLGWRVATGTSVQFYAGLTYYDANGDYLSASDGTGNYPLIVAETFSAAGGWQDRSTLVGPGAPASPYGGTVTFPAGTAFVSPIWYYNYNSVSGAVVEIDYFTVELATAEVGALTQASAAAISASSAATSATNAGTSASAASTSATNAATSAGTAATHATNASNSATTASGHASNASTSAGAAATSATNASNSATAASTSASTASTHATNAGNSATAALVSQVTASSSYTNTVTAGGNPHFVDGTVGWFGGNATYVATHNGRSNVVTFPASLHGLIRSLRHIPVDTTRRYRVKAELYGGAGSGSASSYTGFACYDGAGSYIGEKYAAASAVALAPNSGWTTQTGDVTGTGGSANQFAVGTATVLLFCYTNDNSAAMATAVNYVTLEDITESTAAATSATAAATSASNASTSATAAGTSATSASTSATNAATSAGAASTSATNASNSATTAAGHASSASTSATNAATSAGTAGGSATAAAGSASSAATSATAASNSASAASASQVAAASSYLATVVQGGNTDFAAGTAGWTISNGGSVSTNLGGRSGVFTHASSGAASDCYSVKRFSFDPARKYKIKGSYWTGSGGSGSQLYIGFRAVDSAGTYLTHNPGSYAYVAASGVLQAANAGWVDYTSGVIVPEVAGVSYGYPTGTASIELLCLGNYNGGTTPWGLDSVVLLDVTEQEAAATSATAAATQASNAATSATAAGTSATAASGSATTASTHASTAGTHATNSSTSATGAAGSATAAATSATTASTHASTASTHATTASTQASNASASAASASSSATIAAGVGHRAINRNAGFDGYPASYGRPTDWNSWDGSEAAGAMDRVADGAGGYSIKLTSSAGSPQGVQQLTDAGTFSPDTYYVIEMEAELHSGAWTGSGVYLATYNAAASGSVLWNDYASMATAEDASGFVSSSRAGRRAWSRLVKTASDASISRAYIYVMSHWSGHGSIAAANQITFHKIAIRPATSQEVAAGVALPALQASVSTTQSTVASLSTNYALARYSVSATTGGGAAILTLTSDTYGTIAGIDAAKIYFGDNTVFDNGVDVLVTTWGSNCRITAWGASFGTDSTLTEWEGPTSVTWGNHSRANAHFYRANVAPYAGGSALAPAAPFTVAQSHMSRLGTRFGAGSVTTSTVTLTPTGHTGTVTYTWTNVFGDSTLGATASTSAATAFNGSVAAYEQKQAQFAWMATDSGTGTTVTGYCSATILDVT